LALSDVPDAHAFDERHQFVAGAYAMFARVQVRAGRVGVVDRADDAPVRF
jgi:hypothetical protein